MRVIICLLVCGCVFADWSLPLPSGEPREIKTYEDKGFVANGSGGLMVVTATGDQLKLARSLSTLGDALRVFLEADRAYVFTSSSNLHIVSLKSLEIIGLARLGAWEVVSLTVFKGKIYYVRKLAVEKRSKSGDTYMVDLFFVGRAAISDQGAVVEQEIELGQMRAYDIVVIKDGELALVSLGESGIAVANFLETPAKITDYIGQIGDVRKLGLASERFLLAAANDTVVAISLEKYTGPKTETKTGDEATEIDVPEEKEEIGGEKQIVKLKVGYRAESFSVAGDRILAGGASGVLVLEIPEIGTDLTVLKRWDVGAAASVATFGKRVLWSDGKSRIALADGEGREISSLRTDVKVRAMVLAGRKLLVNTAEELWSLDPETGVRSEGVKLGAVDGLFGLEGKAAALVGDEVRFLDVAEGLRPAGVVKLRSKPQVIALDGERIVYAEGPRKPNDGLDRLWEVKDGREELLRELEGRITAVAIEGKRTALAASDLVQTGGGRGVKRPTTEVLEGKTVVARGDVGAAGQLLLRGDQLLSFDGGYARLIAISGGTLQPRWSTMVSDATKIEIVGDLLLCCGTRGFRSYEIRPDGPYFVARSREPEARFVALAGGDFFGFYGNRIVGKKAPPLRLPESGFVVAEGGIGKAGAALAPEDVVKEYGKSYRILDGSVDVCSKEYEDLRGYRLKPVYKDLSGDGWKTAAVEPECLAVDPKSGRVKFSDGSPATMERLSQAAGIMYNCAGFQRRGDRLYVALGENANPFVVYDIADLGFPKQLGLCPGGVRFPHDIAVDEQMEYAYFPVTYGGLEITRVKDVLGSAYEIVREPATVVATWELPGAKKTFKLQLTTGGRKLAERLNVWNPPAGGSPGCARVYGDLCYVSNRGGFFFVLDIQDRENPKLLGQCPGGGWIADVTDGYAYTSWGGLSIIDVRKPTEPKIVGQLSEYKGTRLCLQSPPREGLIVLSEPFKYGAHNFYVASVRDVTNPTVLGAWIDDTIVCSSGAAILPGGKQALLVDAGSCGADYNVITGMHGRLILFDISDPTRIKKLNTFHAPDEGDYRGIQVDYEKMIAYVSDRSFGVWFYDIRDPARPELLGGAPASGEADYSYLWNKCLYFDTTAGGAFWAVDFSDPLSPKKVGYYWDGVWTERTTIRGKDGVIYAPLAGYGLKVIDGRDPGNLRLKAKLRLNVPCWAYDVDGDWLYAAALENNTLVVKAYDISDSVNPKLHSEFPLKDVAAPVKLDAVGSRLYVASLAKSSESLRVYEFPDRERRKPNELGTLSLAGTVKKQAGWDNWKLQVSGGKAYIFGDGLTPPLTIVRIGDPKRMDVLFANPLDTGDRPMDFTVAGDYIYANWYYPGVQVYDTTDAAHPMKLAAERGGPGGEFDVDAWSSGQVSGWYMYCPKLSFAAAFAVPRSTQAPLQKVTLELRRE